MPTTIPIEENVPNQRFTVNLTPTGEEDPIEHTFYLMWNTRGQFMTIDIDREGERIITGIALKTGVDLFAPYPYLNLGELYVVDLTNTGLELNYNNVNNETIVVRYEDGE
jgi:hypothetical protein